ncbi:f4391dbf-b1b1-4fea-af7c-83e07b6257e9 [Sclerotinia trifoliorum]|uniref:F4391dbf-b1b1-4fea-af7c-83e07b6257e9 n=1 Tax=Sclerotinia trifoliorum TaxID=28548 RepID=A0A8H2VST9_9HELO|nr:f4391dbf-b1b1-4fea-af7c-83e07b6257e9 [Sclerotinia trifoliorum]
MNTHSSASGAPCSGVGTMLRLSPSSEDSSGDSHRHCIGLFECDMCAQYLKSVVVDGGEPLNEEGLAAAKILASLAQDGSRDTTAQDNRNEYATGYALDGEDRLHGSMFEHGGSGGAALGRMAPVQPIHQTKSGAGAFRSKRAEGQGKSSAPSPEKAQVKKAARARATGVNKARKPALSREEREEAQKKRREAKRVENERMKKQLFPPFKKHDRGEPAVALDRMGYPAKNSGVPPELMGRYSDN